TQAHEAGPDLLAAAGLRKLLKDPSVSLHGFIFSPRQLLGPREVHQERLVVEVLRAERGERGAIGVHGLRPVALGLPRVATPDLAGRPQRPRGPPADRDPLGGPRRPVRAGAW